MIHLWFHKDLGRAAGTKATSAVSPVVGGEGLRSTQLRSNRAWDGGSGGPRGGGEGEPAHGDEMSSSGGLCGIGTRGPHETLGRALLAVTPPTSSHDVRMPDAGNSAQDQARGVRACGEPKPPDPCPAPTRQGAAAATPRERPAAPGKTCACRDRAHTTWWVEQYTDIVDLRGVAASMTSRSVLPPVVTASAPSLAPRSASRGSRR